MAFSNSRQQKTYPSKVDAWLAGLLWLGVGVMAFGLAMTWASEQWLLAAQRTAIVGAGAGFIVWVLMGTNYTLHEGDLVVRCGPFSRRMLVKDITGITPAPGLTRLRTSPALSMDRLKVTYGAGRQVLISPRDRIQFLTEIAARGAKV